MLSKSLEFNDEFYRATIRKYGYDEIDFGRFTFPIGAISAEALNLRFLCHHQAGKYAETPSADRVITTGFGMSGIPHLGTVVQVLNCKNLQSAGEKCQIVLGDLDAFNGKKTELGYAQELAERYHDFIIGLGFDSEMGIVRNQYSDVASLRRMYVLARNLPHDIFDDVEEDNHGFYAGLGIVDESMTLARRLSLMLMAADFSVLRDTYQAVMVMLGIDEHRYVRFSQQADSHHRGLASGIEAVYTRMLPGLQGFPKMSKSIPGSAISMDDTRDVIVKTFAQDHVSDPQQSAIFGLAIAFDLITPDNLSWAKYSCARQNNDWTRLKMAVTEHVVQVSSKW